MFNSILHNYLIPGTAILLISVLTHIHISTGSFLLNLVPHLSPCHKKSCSPNTVKAELNCRRKCIPLQLAITILSVMSVASDNSRTFQPIFSCHRLLVSHRYKRPTIVCVNEDTAVQETFNKYLGIIFPSSAYYLSKLYPN